MCSALAGCAVPYKNVDNHQLTPTTNEFVSVHPGNSDWVERQTGNGIKRQYWSELNNQEINDLLPLEKNFVSILKTDHEVGVGYMGAKFSGNAGNYTVIFDYSKYRDELTDNGNLPCLVGVGIRIKASITTKKANLDLGSLIAIGFAAKAGNLTGTMEITKIGINSPKLGSMPNFAEISESSIQSAIQVVGAIQNRMYDESTKLTPHVLAVQLARIDPAQQPTARP
ncbi:hypothetical protein AYO28_27070 [Pseudomonas putida]|nr:hypothetical protein AYO28_27070 [Pseudomonas putida]